MDILASIFLAGRGLSKTAAFLRCCRVLGQLFGYWRQLAAVWPDRALERTERYPTAQSVE